MSGGGIEKMIDFVFDYIFPCFCVSCGREGSFVCNQCLETLEVLGVFCCPVCHRDREMGKCCPECAQSTSLSSHIALMPLSETALIHELIHLYKYQYIEKLENTFLTLIHTFFTLHQLPEAEYLVPVPLHKKRYVERGFNQSEHIAILVSRATGIPILRAITRTKNTVKQATLDRSGREKNVQHAFAVDFSASTSLSHSRVILVDDVYTTGSTLRECATSLREGGCREVHGFSIARG